MTRDEHIKIEMDRLRAGPALCGQHPGIVRVVAESNVNFFVRHGILKLDEPKAPYEILAEELNWGTSNTRFLKETLDRCGLRVVRT